MLVDKLNTAAAARSGVIERATAVLDTFLDGPEWMGLDDISLLSGIPRSTTFRILRQLVELCWLEHGEHGYRLGPRIRRYRSRATDCEDLRVAASTALTELHLATDGVAHLAVLDGLDVNYLDKVGGAAAQSVPSRIGVRIPATDTVSGHVLLASLDPEQADTAINRAKNPTRQPVLAPACSADQVYLAIKQARNRRGLAYHSAVNCQLGITAIAAPITGPTGTVGAISLSVRRQAEFQQLAPLLVRAARRTGQALSAQHRMAG
ncbi:helix-turn-helix domain-containing protein [Mycobacterium sp. NPDC049093]